MPKPTITEPIPATKGGVPGLRKTKTSAPIGISAEPARTTGRTPTRDQMRGERVAPIGQPSTIAERAKPATSGGLCITPWTKTGRKVVSPMITMPANSEEALTAAIGRRPQSSSEIIGSGERRSWTTKATTAATATRVMRAISPRPAVASAVRSAITAAMAMVKTPALTWSIRPRASDLFSCRQNQKPAEARRPTGRFIQKIQAQVQYWMMRPPISGPMTAGRACAFRRGLRRKASAQNPQPCPFSKMGEGTRAVRRISPVANCSISQRPRRKPDCKGQVPAPRATDGEARAVGPSTRRVRVS